MCKRCDKIFRQRDIRSLCHKGVKYKELKLREQWERDYVEWLRKRGEYKED